MDEDKKRPTFRLGDTVRILSGPLTEFTGKIEGINQSKALLKVNVRIDGRNLPIRLSFADVKVVAGGRKIGKKRQTFRLGDTVRILSGPFTESTAKIEGINQSRALLKVKVYGRDLPIKLSFADVKVVTEGRKIGKKRQTFRLGDAVRILSGPFTEFTGRIEGINQSKALLKVKVRISGRNLPIKLSFADVKVVS